MIGPGPRNKTGALRLAFGLVIGKADLDGGIDGFRPGRPEKDAVETFRQNSTERFGKFEGDRRRALEVRGIIQNLKLLVDGFGNLLAAMPRCTGEQA